MDNKINKVLVITSYITVHSVYRIFEKNALATLSYLVIVATSQGQNNLEMRMVYCFYIINYTELLKNFVEKIE